MKFKELRSQTKRFKTVCVKSERDQETSLYVKVPGVKGWALVTSFTGVETESGSLVLSQHTYVKPTQQANTIVEADVWTFNNGVQPQMEVHDDTSAAFVEG